MLESWQQRTQQTAKMTAWHLLSTWERQPILLLLLLLLLRHHVPAENGVADLSQNRYIYLHKLLRDEGFRTEYAWGPSIKYSIAKNHTLPNGQKMPLWAKLETPQVGHVSDMLYDNICAIIREAC
jgi:hypothetical protein